MRRFLINLLTFAAVITVITLGTFYFTNEQINDRGNFKIAAGKDLVILGHSAPTCAFNDSLIKNCINLSDPTEGYFYTYIKARKLLPDNTHIRTVFIEFTNNQFTEYANARIYGQYANHLVPKYYAQMNLKEVAFLFSKTPWVMLSNIPVVMKNNFRYLGHVDSSYIQFSKWGAYNPLTQVLTQEEIDESRKKDAARRSLIKYHYGSSDVSLWYLAKLVQELRNRNVQVVFIRSPYFDLNHKAGTDGILHDIHNNEFPGVPFLDFMKIPLLPSDFAEPEHMNIQGARKVSVFLDHLLQKGLLQAGDPQKFFEHAIDSAFGGQLAATPGKKALR
jgi:hypothetical protein